MSGTTGNVELDSQLLNEDRDQQGTGAIKPQNLRNIVVSKLSRNANVRTITAAGSVTHQASDDVIVINKAVSAATTVNLIAAPATGATVTIKDGRGDAGVSPITIIPAAGVIDGQSSIAISVAWGAATLVYNGSGWTVRNTAFGIVTNAESPDATTVTNTAQTIYASQTAFQPASSGAVDIWSLDGSGHAIHNGVVDTSQTGITELYYHNHALYTQNTGGTWNYWNTHVVVPSINEMPDSSNSTLATGVLGSGGALPTGIVATQNGLVFNIVGSGIDSATGLPYFDLNISGTTTSGGANISSGGLAVTPASVATLSVYTALVGGSNANITQCAMAWSEYIGGVYSFTPSGSVDILPSSSTLTRHSFSTTTGSSTDGIIWYMGWAINNNVNVNATYRFAGIQFQEGTLSPFVSTPQYGGGWQTGVSPLAPAPAATAGFNTLAFSDDFTTTNTIAPAANTASGYKWYWGYNPSASSNEWSVNTTATAASISNGNSGGGSFASAAGGILTINQAVAGSGLISVPGNALNNSNATLPSTGTFKHCYIEAYIQCMISPNSSNATGWPAFWAWAVQALKNYGFGSSALAGSDPPGWTELDMFETFGTNYGNTPGNWASTLHNWHSNGSNESSGGGINSPAPWDNNWHKIGCLWQSTGTGTGKVSFYRDDVLCSWTDGTTSIPTGTGQVQVALESESLFLIMTSGLGGWPLNVDWVKVWTA